MGADLIALLGQAQNGLGVFRAMQGTAGHNIENANTPGYSRQRVEPATMGAAFLGPGSYLGRGVTIGGITQSRDAFLERQIPTAFGSAAQHSAESAALDSVSALDPDATAGLGDAISAFYSSMRELAQNPGDSALRIAVVGAANRLATAFNNVGESLESARSGIDVKFAADIDEANQAAADIARLNKEIMVARGRGAEPNDLLDQRLKAQDRLSQLTGAVPVPDSDGNVSMVLPSGLALVSGTQAGKLSTRVDSANDGHLTLQITRVGASAPDSGISPNDLGGELRGMTDARDVGLKQALNQIDTMAFDVANTVNTQQQLGFDLDGNAGGAFFSVGPTAAGASRSLSVAVTARGIAAAGASASGPGDASNLNLMVATERSPLSGGGDVAASLSSIIASFGTASRSAKAMADQDQGIVDHLNGLRESASGVSIDEEMISMTQAQRAFEAITKMISVTDSMLGTLMAIGPGPSG